MGEVREGVAEREDGPSHGGVGGNAGLGSRGKTVGVRQSMWGLMGQRESIRLSVRIWV